MQHEVAVVAAAMRDQHHVGLLAVQLDDDLEIARRRVLLGGELDVGRVRRLLRPARGASGEVDVLQRHGRVELHVDRQLAQRVLLEQLALQGVAVAIARCRAAAAPACR